MVLFIRSAVVQVQIAMEFSEEVLEGVRLAGSSLLDDKKFEEVLDTAVKGLESPNEYKEGQTTILKYTLVQLE